MIGVVYTGETESELYEEISKASCVGEKIKIFVEAPMRQKFMDVFSIPTWYTANGWILDFCGLSLTTSLDEYEKRFNVTISKKQIAEKFGIPLKNLIIGD